MAGTITTTAAVGKEIVEEVDYPGSDESRDHMRQRSNYPHITAEHDCS